MRAVDQVAKLESAFLWSISSQFPDLLDDSENANLHAFLVLSHAVLEEDIEAAFEEYFDELSRQLGEDRVPVAGLLLAYAIAEQVSTEKKIAYKKRHTVSFVQKCGRDVLEKVIRSNNGLKEQNLEKLARAVGLHWEDFEQSLGTAIADLNTFGSKRGSSSHLSPFSSKVTSITGQLDPEDVKRWVSDAVAGVNAIRAHLLSLISSTDPQPRTRKQKRLSSAVTLQASRAIRRN